MYGYGVLIINSNIEYQLIDVYMCTFVIEVDCLYKYLLFSTDQIPETIAICDISCNGYETQLIKCEKIQSCNHDFNYCSHSDDIAISCCKAIILQAIATIVSSVYFLVSNFDDSSSSGSSSGAIVGSIFGGLFIVGLIFSLFCCRLFMKYSYYTRRNQNHAYIVTQQQTPRVLVARVTHTVPSGPPPPPAYTPTAPDVDYTPVPPRDYQPVSTTDYTPAGSTDIPSIPSDNVPSDPPPDYASTVSTNASMAVPEDSSN